MVDNFQDRLLNAVSVLSKADRHVVLTVAERMAASAKIPSTPIAPKKKISGYSHGLDSDDKKLYRPKKISKTNVDKGTRIVLKDGDGPKRKYNGHEVEVLDCPLTGGWITVAFEGRAMKWRKGQYDQEPTKAEKEMAKLKQDLMFQMNDFVYSTIFGFLGDSSPLSDEYGDKETFGIRKLNYFDRSISNGPEDIVSVKDAVKTHSLLSAVCKRWRSICHNNMGAIFGPIKADLDALFVHQAVPCIHWMIKHRVSLGSLMFHADYGDIPFLEKLLNTCDTSGLTFVRALCNTIYFQPEFAHDGYSSYGSQWVSEAYAHKGDTWAVDVSDYNDKLPEKCYALAVPYSRSCLKLQVLHKAIAANCENLLELQVNVDIPEEAIQTNIQDYMCSTLFSLDCLHKLELYLSVKSGLTSVLDAALRNLVNLEELSIRCPKGPIHCSENRRIHVASKNLRVLDASGLPKYSISGDEPNLKTWISGDLPNLKTLIYHGYCSGIAPQFRGDPRLEPENDGSYHFHAGPCIIHNLSIPPACEIIADFVSTGDSHMVAESRNATIC